MNLKMPREFYIPKKALKVADKRSDAVVYLYGFGEKFGAIGFVGKANKPAFNYTFRKPERREEHIREFFTNYRDRLARKAAVKSARVAWVPTYKVGDIFRTCWGYEQTNVEYFEIIEIKGKHAILREICQESVETGWLQGKCAPLPGQFAAPRYAGDDRGQPIRRLMQEHGIKIDDVRTAWLVKGDIVGGVRVIQPSSWSAYH